MVSYCGIICTECPGYIATQNDDDQQRRKIAEEWSKNYNVDVKPEDVNCDGCLSDTGRLIGHCHVCEIRKCGQEKNIKNCAYCNKYSCEKLTQFHNMVKDAKKNLEDIRNDL
jgi:hypothetical protein